MGVPAPTRTPRRQVLLASLVAVLGSMAAIASGLSVDVALAQPQARTVTMGRIGDRWLDTIKFRKIERATRNKTFGYNITYHLTGPDSHVLFWPRDKIDFTGRSPGYRLQVMPLGSGRLWYPDKITATSLPDVHRCILMIEGDYIKQADGAIAAMEGFATVASLGAGTPTLRAPIPKPVPRTTLPTLAPRAAAPAAGGTITIKGFSATESAVIREAKGIVFAKEFETIRAAHAAGRSATVKIGGRVIQYEPGLPASGMTMFGESGFIVGPEAFASSGELGRTVLHELYRLTTSQSASGVSSAMATAETSAAAAFAERAFSLLGL